MRLAAVTIAGVVAMVLATVTLYAIRSELEALGYTVPMVVFIIAFFVIVGGLYGGFAKVALREAKRLSEGTTNASPN